MKVFNAEYLGLLVKEAARNQRKRQHRNIHESYKEPCQRLFNALGPGSILLKVKAGPFDLGQPKEFAAWAPNGFSDKFSPYYDKIGSLLKRSV